MADRKYPIVFWVHSPIGFETYLSFKALEKSLGIELKLFLTRHISHKDADLQTNDNGLVWDQNSNSQERTWRELGRAISKIIENSKGYTLCVPQSGIPYVEALIESPHCKGYTYYEDGTLNYDVESAFKIKADRLCYKYSLQIGPEAAAAMDLLEVAPDSISSRHLNGVKLLDFEHEKYLGSFAFFEEAFPGHMTTLLPIADLQDRAATEKTGIILAPNGKTLKSTTSLKDYLISVRNIMGLHRGINWTVKLHPNQKPEEEDRFAKWLSTQGFSAFSRSHPEVENRETAFLDFSFYVTPSNSTLHYLKLKKRSNFIVLDYPKT
jgi:hypothetical protein